MEQKIELVSKNKKEKTNEKINTHKYNMYSNIYVCD